MRPSTTTVLPQCCHSVLPHRTFAGAGQIHGQTTLKMVDLVLEQLGLGLAAPGVGVQGCAGWV